MARPEQNDTIVAIATPLGAGGLGVVRLSGPQAIPIAARLFKGTDFSHALSHTLHHGWIKKQSEIIDETVLSLFRNPHSYTGEDVIEFSCHGSPAVLKEIVALAQTEGARHAAPGEFTERAYLNGKLDLAQAEAVAELIAATSSSARAVAAAHLRGVLSDKIKSIRDQLVQFTAHVEANLDFVEEDIPGVLREEMDRRLGLIAAEIKNLLATSVKGRILREGLNVPLVGRPNVGKSSLFNALLAADRAIVTDIPGTTRDTLEEKLQWDGLTVVLTDTAGLRDTSDVIEKKGTDRSKAALSTADIVLLVVDGSSALTAEDRALFSGLMDKRVIAVLNKKDRGLKVKPEALSAVANEVVATSATSGAGLAELKQTLVKMAAGSTGDSAAGIVVTQLRHVEHLERALSEVEACQAAVKAGRSEELLSVSAKAALQELGQITGEAVNEDVLSSIFSQFCIGK